MAGHVLRLERKTRPYSNVLGARRKRGGRRRGEALSKKTWKIWMSAGMETAGSPVTVKYGDFSSPDALRGTVGPKSKTSNHFNPFP